MTTPNIFLRGSFAPVTEEITAFDLPVTGQIPAELTGRYLRNGPNPLGLDEPGYRFGEGHWFLGPGMVHGVRLRDGRAEWYRNRWVRSQRLAGALGEKWPGVQLPYTWNPAHQARVGLLPRDGSASDIRWVEVDPCWIFHTMNAYDDDGRVVVDVVRYDGAYDVSLLAGHGPLTLDRWIIDPAVGKMTTQRLDDRGQEFPRVDDRLVSQRHRFGYSAIIGEVSRATISLKGEFADQAFANALLKHDLARGTVEEHQFATDATAGEAVFAPSSADTGEDDGYVMAFIHNPDRGAADLVILAAQDFTGEPVARVHLPGRVPLGFHGSWVPDE